MACDKSLPVSLTTQSSDAYIHNQALHDDVIKWKHFPRYWPFVRGIHRSPVNSPHKGQWRGALLFYFICACLNGWVNNHEAGDLRRHGAHYDVIVMLINWYCPVITRSGSGFCGILLGAIYKNCSKYQVENELRKYTFKNNSTSPRVWVNFKWYYNQVRETRFSLMIIKQGVVIIPTGTLPLLCAASGDKVGIIITLGFHWRATTTTTNSNAIGSTLVGEKPLELSIASADYSCLLKIWQLRELIWTRGSNLGPHIILNNSNSNIPALIPSKSNLRWNALKSDRRWHLRAD